MTPTMTFHEKTALITGAGHGIGAATARLLCQRNIKALILLDLASDAIDSLTEELRRHIQHDWHYEAPLFGFG